MAKLPEGTVTFLFTDIEGSTRLAQRVGAAFAELIETQGALPSRFVVTLPKITSPAHVRALADARVTVPPVIAGR